jgi:folate-dependent phosphoribosylglycinamide formyltransferase PurN
LSLRTVLYTFESDITLAAAARLVDTGKIAAVILQTPMDLRAKLRFLRGRLARYGTIRVADELLFKLHYFLFLKASDERLRRTLDFDRHVTKASIEARAESYEVSSLNTADGRALLARLQPDLVVMMSREMLRPDVLSMARLGFVGCHPGILPEYRGVYAAFWAQREGKPEKVGVTVYVANAGVDTGPLVAERTVEPRFGVRHFKVESERLMLEGVRDLIETIEKAERGALTTYTKPDAESRMFSHVGLSDYLRAIARA